jgi:hypothetical protein
MMGTLPIAKKMAEGECFMRMEMNTMGSGVKAKFMVMVGSRNKKQASLLKVSGSRDNSSVQYRPKIHSNLTFPEVSIISRHKSFVWLIW